jgi:class 3 adenylate cyclase
MTDLIWAAAAAIVIAGLAIGRWMDRRRLAQLERLLGLADAKLEHLELQFAKFTPAQIVDQLTDATGAFAPERRRVTIMFADLRGFTALCDRLDPGVTVSMLNGYFHHMNQAVSRHHGHINELAGDGLLALFGALESNPWQARDAVLAALDMRAELASYNVTLRAQGLPDLRFGVGIHSGEVVAGVMGAGGLFKFQVSGDPVNVASRVEGLTVRFQVDLLITEEIRAALDDNFRLQPMPAAEVKGKPEPIRTFHVEGLATELAEQTPAHAASAAAAVSQVSRARTRDAAS